MSEKNKSKQLKRDFTLSYIAGIMGGATILILSYSASAFSNHEIYKGLLFLLLYFIFALGLYCFALNRLEKTIEVK